MSIYTQLKKTLNVFQDSPQLPPVPSPQQKTSKERAFREEPLTQADRQDLATIRSHPGYEVIMNICERECERFVTNLLAADESSDAKVIAAQRMAKAARIFFDHVQRTINYEINELLGDNQPEFNDNPDLDDPAVVARLLDPIA